MKKLILLFFLIFIYKDLFTQILPTFQGIYKPTSSQSFSNFNFDPNTKGSKIVISNNNRTVGSTQVAGNSCNWQSVYLLPGISMGTGIKTVEFTIDSYSNTPGNAFDMVIGVDQGNTNGSSLYSNPGGYGWIAEQGALYGYGVSNNCLSGGNTPSYGTTYGQGDVIKLELDSDNETLIFCKNNVCHGVAYGPNCFDNNTTYYFSVAICNQNYAVSIN
tara:strand:- start:123 stop:773 length:651 start_codon:yes stop_codon:yes gene_type:complete